jgi:protein gp37
MGKDSAIQWTDHTFNPWWGCQRVSPGCENCYAEAFDHRLGRDDWGPKAQRRFFGEKHWAEPEKWNRATERQRVFCASMADVFEDRRDLDSQRARLWTLIHKTPQLDWQLLTKRPENMTAMLPWGNGMPWLNVWCGTTVEDEKRAAERIPALRDVPAKVRFLSMEPLLGPVDLTGRLDGIDWVICGGESGFGARPFDLAWARSIRDQCRDAGVAFFCKQLGANSVWPLDEAARSVYRSGRIRLKDLHGGDWDEWPADLRVREFPGSRRAGE